MISDARAHNNKISYRPGLASNNAGESGKNCNASNGALSEFKLNHYPIAIVNV